MLTQIRSGDVREASRSSSSVDQERDQLKAEAQQFYEAAKAKAEAGEVTEAGLLILKGLNCERRAKARGPQVLGLIRKRD
jgi:hypothetical protein